MKNGKTVYYNIICGDYVFVAAARKYFNYRELSEKKKRKNGIRKNRSGGLIKRNILKN